VARAMFVTRRVQLVTLAVVKSEKGPRMTPRGGHYAPYLERFDTAKTLSGHRT
jgi:hypothetical protein